MLTLCKNIQCIIITVIFNDWDKSLFGLYFDHVYKNLNLHKEDPEVGFRNKDPRSQPSNK